MSIKLKKLVIKNFKCFGSQKGLDFAKLTILTGGNSSGKSSILHSILGPIQSGEFPFKFSTNGKYINMGDFREISNQHLNRPVSFQYTFKHKNLKYDFHIKTTWINDKKNSQPLIKAIELSSGHFLLSLNRVRDSYYLDFEYNPINDPEYDEIKSKKLRDQWKKSLLLTLERHANKKGIKERLKKEMEYIENAYNPVRFKNFLINDLNKLAIEAKKKNNMTLDYIIDIFLYKTWNEYDSITNAISSFRLHPERTYLEQSKERLRVDKFGEGYLDQIILWEKNNSNEFWELKKILKEDLGLLHSIRSNRKMGGGRFEILVQPKENSTETSLFDVGFGINQFTPIIVADLQLGEGSTLYIAEPEIHLHPNVQAKLGNYLAKQVETNKKNYVIEMYVVKTK